MTKRLLLITILVIPLSGCFSVLATTHENYCNTYSDAQRTAFRVLTGHTVTINCSEYK